MSKKTIVFLVVFALTISLVIVPLLTACDTTETTSTTIATTTSTTTGTKTTAATTSTTTITTVTPSSTSTTTSANWWDDVGTPQYGGTLTIRASQLDLTNFDPSIGGVLVQHTGYWLEGLFGYDWKLDRNVFSFQAGFTPEEYRTGLLAESWEWSEPLTLTINIRQGVHWQNKEPVNGRELTATDIQYSFDQILGTGSGFTAPKAYAAQLSNIERVVATDQYTLSVKFKKAGAMNIYMLLDNAPNTVAREWVEAGDLNNWKTAVGSGPWMLTDYISGSSITFSKNPDYWGIDERHPENSIPYLDSIKEIAIPDISTAIASLRTGKIDMIVDSRYGLDWQKGLTLEDTNPEIQQAQLPSPGYSIDLRVDTKPFTDIRVRKALQMSIDRNTIAQYYRGGTVDGIPCGTASPVAYKGWITAYEDWPQELKDNYSYNTEMAKQLLTEAAADGIFEPNKNGGFDTNVVANSSDDLQLLQVIKAYFSDIGVEMEIKSMESAAYSAFTSGGKHDQMVYVARTGMSNGPSDIIRYRAASQKQRSYIYANDPLYEAMVTQFDATTDLEEAKALIKESDMYLLEQNWTVYLFPEMTPIAWQPWVKGYSGEVMPGGYSRGFYGARIWVDQD